MSAACVCSHVLDDHKCVTWDPTGEMADKKGTCWRCPCEGYVPSMKRPAIEVAE